MNGDGNEIRNGRKSVGLVTVKNGEGLNKSSGRSDNRQVNRVLKRLHDTRCSLR